MNNYISINSFTEYFATYRSKKDSQIDYLINNLKITDVKEDGAFFNTKERIKNQILIKPVVFQELTVLDHSYVQITPNFQQQLTGQGSYYSIQVGMGYTGDSSLFSLSPEHGYSFSASDHGRLMPIGNQLIIEVNIPELNLEAAKNVARKDLAFTLGVVAANNSSAETWNVIAGQRIDEKLRLKREELIKVFGT